MDIAYVGPYLSVGVDSAARQRALGISRALTASGARVHVAGGDMCERLLDLPPGVTGTSVGEWSDPAASRARKGWDRIQLGRASVEWLSSLSPQPEAVILYGGGAIFARRVMRWAEEHRVPVVVDCVEWYDGRHQPMGRFGPVNLDNEWAMRRIFPHSGNVITISTYLEQYFAARRCKTLRIPPTTDVQSQAWRRELVAMSDAPIRLAYAGIPGKKDLIDTLVQGIRDADPDGRKFRLELVGMSLEEVRRLPSCHEGVPPWLSATGRLTREAALEAVASAHFTCLIRPDERYAHAGFPTKVTESLAVGTPVICNLTSDLGGYLREGETAVVAADSTRDAFADALKRAHAIGHRQYTSMRAAARREALANFDWRPYVNPLRTFFERLTNSF